jgi:hypothetical protein
MHFIESLRQSDNIYFVLMRGIILVFVTITMEGKIMKKHWTLLALVLFLAPNAFAAGEGMFSVVGGVDYNLNSDSLTVGNRTASIKGGLGFGFGVLKDFGANFEVGVLYLSKKFNTTVTGGADSSTSVSTYEVPFMLHTSGSAIRFGIGGFFDSADSSSDYGLTAETRFGGANGGVFLDLRFNYALKTGNTKDLLAFVGYAFGK